MNRIPKSREQFKRDIIKVEVELEKTNIVYSLNKHQTCRRYRFHLSCGHTMTQYSQGAGYKPLKKKQIICEFCEETYIYGEQEN